MNLKLIVFIASAIVFILPACSVPVSSICPPIGTVSSIDKPESPYRINDLLDTGMPNFTWQSVDCNSLQVLNQTAASFIQLTGKPAIIVFHKSMNCPGCKEQLPYIQGAYENLKDTGLTILTIYRGDQVKSVKNYVQSNNINFTALADPEDKVAAKLGFGVGAPISVFVDKNGIIKEYRTSPLKSQSEIEDILKTL